MRLLKTSRIKLPTSFSSKLEKIQFDPKDELNKDFFKRIVLKKPITRNNKDKLLNQIGI